MSQSGRVCGLTNTFCLREPTAALLLDRFVYNSMLYKWMAFLPIVAFKALMWSSVSVRTLFVSYILCRFTLNDSDGANKKYFLFKSTTVQICQTKSAFDVNFSLLKLHFFSCSFDCCCCRCCGKVVQRQKVDVRIKWSKISTACYKSSKIPSDRHHETGIQMANEFSINNLGDI